MFFFTKFREDVERGKRGTFRETISLADVFCIFLQIKDSSFVVYDAVL